MLNTDKSILKHIRSGCVQAVGLGSTKPGEPVNASCGVNGCSLSTFTHIVDVVWEMDPEELDRRWVRLELRCENGHGFMLLFRNHAGETRFESVFLDDIVSPFAEGSRW